MKLNLRHTTFMDQTVFYANNESFIEVLRIENIKKIFDAEMDI